MAETNLRKTVVAIRDQLGSLDNVNAVGVWDYDEEVVIEEGPIAVRTRDLTGDSIWDHPTLGVWDTSLWDDGNYTNNPVWVRVVNPENIFHEHFRENSFEDTTNSTASFDTTNFRWEFKSGDVAQTNSLHLNQESKSSVTPKLLIKGVSVTVTINQITNPGGVQKDIT